VKAGWRGLAAAGSCFIFPAVAITLLLAYLYVHYGTVPQFGPFMFGIRAGIIAVILAAVFRLSKPLVKKRHLTGVGLAVMVINLLGVDEIILLFGAGLGSIVWEHHKRIWQKAFSIFNLNVLPGLAMLLWALGQETNSAGAGVTSLGLFFLKIGAILYGSGYVLVAFLEGGLVENYHWLTQQQLLDAIAIGQFTPGPILSTATFIGYLLLGLPGATVATIGIFLPSFIFVLLSSPFIPILRRSPVARSFLDGVNAGALGLMLAVCVSLGLSSLASVSGWLIFGLAVVVLVKWNINAAWVILGSAGLGWSLTLLL
jgi:chromate transporter